MMSDDNSTKGEMKEKSELNKEKHLNHTDEPIEGENPGALDPQAWMSEEALVDEAVEELQRHLEATQAKADEYLDGWQRARAEFANYKKRIEREQAIIYQNTAGNVIKRFLEVADDLERALKNRPNDQEGAQWANGIELIYRKVLATIEGEGVTRIEPNGQFFDPTYHEAISQEDSPGYESGQIIEVLQPGYMLGERVLRPARVRVAR